MAAGSKDMNDLPRSGFSGLAWDPYGPRLNRAMDYIEAHLAEDLPLELVARVAAFSEGHFHRVFKAWTHETFSNLIQRRRLEIAALRLRHNRWDSVTWIAHTSGFASSETFARAFKRRFGIPATDWRRFDWVADEDARIGNVNLERFSGSAIQVKKFESSELVYWRMHGQYEYSATQAWQRFLAWLPTMGLGDLPLIGIGLDDPSITPVELCRYDTCAVLPASVDWFSTRASRKISDAGWYACMDFRGTRSEIRAAWHWMKSRWLPGSGFSLGASPFLEYYAPGSNPLTEDWTVEAQLRMPIIP